jgi:hypothetical protein
MSRKMTIKVEKIKPRNPYVVPSRQKRGGPMKDRRSKRQNNVDYVDESIESNQDFDDGED